MEYINSRLREISTYKGIISFVAGIIMYFTPDNIDQIIQMVLLALGVTDIFAMEKKK